MKTLEQLCRITEPNNNFRLEDALRVDIMSLHNDLCTATGKSLEARGAKRALRLFHHTAVHVPAYTDFLKKHKVNHEKIITSNDFLQVPPTSKKNYIEEYPLKDRLGDGDAPSIVGASSGTTGTPTLWPRTVRQEAEAMLIHELIYQFLFEVEPDDDALIAIGFPLGVYVSGIATTIPTSLISAKGYHYTTITSGLTKDRLLAVIKECAHPGQKILLIGHPFFVKDVAESGADAGVDWKVYSMNVMLCSEGFSEAWRDYLMNLLGVTDEARIINTYGSAELLLMATETPLTIALRRRATNDVDVRACLFGEVDLIPGVFQYNPLIRYIESINGTLYHTVASGVPLIRYDIGDIGDIISYEKVQSLTSLYRDEAKPHWRLPFVTLYGRKGNTVLYYGINIYPELFRHAFDSSPELLKSATGKFTMRTALTGRMDPVLEIHIELRPGQSSDRKWKNRIAKYLHQALTETCMEYRFLVGSGRKIYLPKIITWPYQHEKYFRPGMKPKFIS